MKSELSQRSPHLIATLLLVSVLGATGLPALAGEYPVVNPTRSAPRSTVISNAAKIPPEIVATLRQDLSQRTGIPTNQLKFVEVSPQTWTNGCLGLAQSDEMCSQAMVNGWRVVFAQGNRRWVYRTNGSGSAFRLEGQSTARTSQSPRPPKPDSLPQTKIPVAELPPQLQRDMVFRTIATGGFAGQSIQTTLYRDGRLIRENMRPIGTAAPVQVRQIPPQKVREFMTLLRQNRMHKLDRADYQPAPGSADFITTTLSCPSCTIRYADSTQAELPTNLQAVIQAWNELARTL
ncbi:MAG: hypothetical protein NW224_30930 [Leptolyngbyaceae cyanobacterium bins.302]|nr:hypothetical protein [Leptolyngbyaceae cyanobacterium bins.302]